MAKKKKTTRDQEVKSEHGYSSQSFSVYAQSRSGNFSTSASYSSDSKSIDDQIDSHVKNKSIERRYYATKRK